MLEVAQALARVDLDPDLVRAFLRGEPGFIRDDLDLLADLGLRLDAANLVDFGPAALARVAAAHERESTARKRLEDIARANYDAQAQAQGAVIDILDAADLTDLAARVSDLAVLRFQLAAGVLAVEGLGDAPDGWRQLVETQVDMLVGPGRASRIGFFAPALGLFGEQAQTIGSMALMRLNLWGGRQGVLAFGAETADGFTPDMGDELVGFLARVVERAAARWPIA